MNLLQPECSHDEGAVCTAHNTNAMPYPPHHTHIHTSKFHPHSSTPSKLPTKHSTKKPNIPQFHQVTASASLSFPKPPSRESTWGTKMKPKVQAQGTMGNVVFRFQPLISRWREWMLNTSPLRPPYLRLD